MPKGIAMNHDAAHAVAILVGSSATVIAAAAPQAPLSDMQILIISGACGAIGGVVATLMSDVVITFRGLIMRGLASVLIAPGIVALTLIHYGIEPRLLTVAAASGVAGMIAWPVASNLQKLVPSWLKMLWEKFFGGSHK